MKSIFKFVFCIFFLAGGFIFATLASAVINEGLLKVFGVMITVPSWLFDRFMSIFQTCGILTLLTFPVVLVNLIARGFQEEGKKMLWPAGGIALMFVVCPITLLLVEHNYQHAGLYICVWVAALIIGGRGNEYKIPFESC